MIADNPFSLRCSANCHPPCSYAWFQGPLPRDSVGGKLAVGKATTAEGGFYTCRATNSVGSMVSDPVVVEVQCEFVCFSFFSLIFFLLFFFFFLLFFFLFSFCFPPLLFSFSQTHRHTDARTHARTHTSFKQEHGLMRQNNEGNVHISAEWPLICESNIIAKQLPLKMMRRMRTLLTTGPVKL